MYQGRLKYLVIVCLTTFSMVLYAQNEGKGAYKDKHHKRITPVNQMAPVEKSGVDTLSVLDRIALRTNIVDWTLLIPNIGMEFDVKNTNWNRWTVGFNVRYNWQTSHTYKPSYVFNLFQVRLEGRQYWRTRDMRKKRLDPHKHFWEKAISIRRKRAKHPSTTWYRGAFVAYNKYSFLLGDKGHQGTSYMAGVSYGIIRPMYAFDNGNSLDLEFGVSGGVVYYKDDVYRHNADTDSYPLIERKPGQILPMINEIRVGLVYRLGHVPVLTKYRYRRDVDLNYNNRLNERLDSITAVHREKMTYKEAREQIERRFWHVYDSIARMDRDKRLSAVPVQAPKTDERVEKAGSAKQETTEKPQASEARKEDEQ